MPAYKIFVGAFERLQTATTSVFMSICPVSFRMNNLVTARRIFFGLAKNLSSM